jgi:hypothetical protein
MRTERVPPRVVVRGFLEQILSERLKLFLIFFFSPHMLSFLVGLDTGTPSTPTDIRLYSSDFGNLTTWRFSVMKKREGRKSGLYIPE